MNATAFDAVIHQRFLDELGTLEAHLAVLRRRTAAVGMTLELDLGLGTSVERVGKPLMV